MANPLSAKNSFSSWLLPLAVLLSGAACSSDADSGSETDPELESASPVDAPSTDSPTSTPAPDNAETDGVEITDSNTPTANAPTPLEFEPGSADQGRLVFGEPLPGGNTFACATCHALSEPANDGFRRPGHPMDNVLTRSSYKNGRLSEFVQAANSCRDDWMALPEPWTESSEEYLALVEFLEQETTTEVDPTAALEFTIVEPPAMADLMGGQMGEGQDLFNTTCAVCHGTDARGTSQAPALVGDRLTVELIAQRVRTSGSPQSVAYEGLTGGRMPFWSEERLSDEELQDLIAFVMNVDGMAEVEDPDQPVDTGDGRQCDSTHPKVGQTAELRNFSHGIGGTAEILDDCTIQITNFNYDAGGINVRIYGGLGGDYDNGFALTGENLVRRDPYVGETLTVQLPEGMTLDDLDGVSVWCVPIGINFGDGLFN